MATDINSADTKDTLVYDLQDILHMLTPGIEVIGLFVVCSTTDDVVKDTNAWDRVKLIYRVLRKLCPESSRYYLLTHCASKTDCKLVVGDKANLDKNEFKSTAVEVAEQQAYKLVQINAQFSLTRSHFLRSYDWANGGQRGHMGVSKLKQLLVDGLEKTLNTALITFNGEIPQAKQCVQDVTVSQTEAGGDSATACPVVAEFYEQNLVIGEKEEVKRSNDLLQLKGCVASRLFVYPDDALEYVESLLRKDLLKSITQRIDRAAESVMHQDEEPEEVEGNTTNQLSESIGENARFKAITVGLFIYSIPFVFQLLLRLVTAWAAVCTLPSSPAMSSCLTT